MVDIVLKALDTKGTGLLPKDELLSLMKVLSPEEFSSGEACNSLLADLKVDARGNVDLRAFLGIQPGMKIAIFSAAPYVQKQMQPLIHAMPGSWFVDTSCSASTAPLCNGAQAVCLFVNDAADKDVIQVFKQHGVKLILLRCAGFDRVDLQAAAEAGIRVVRVPAYSPYAVAEHAVSLTLCLNRRLHKARDRTRSGNYALSGLVGVDLNGKTCGIAGTGKIGQIAAKCFAGLGMKLLCYDPFPNDVIKELGGKYVSLDQLYANSDVISLHVPLIPATYHMIDEDSIAKFKRGVILINVSRGGLVNTDALIGGLTSGAIGMAGLDVYENEAALFFKDLSKLEVEERMSIFDRKFALLRSLPNVLITPHTAFLTYEALTNICDTTVVNAKEFVEGKKLTNEVVYTPPKPAPPAVAEEVMKRMSTLSTRNSVDGPKRELQKQKSLCTVGTDHGDPIESFKIAIFSSFPYVKKQMDPLIDKFPNSVFFDATCNAATASLCAGADAVCLFVNDNADEEVIQVFKKHGIKLMLLRCAGFDRVDLVAAEAAGIKVARVPAYSPYAVAEQAVSLALTLNRHLHKAYNRMLEGVMDLSGLVGMDLNGKVCGILGTGKIGQIAAKIFKGFGMRVVCYDVFKNDVITKELGLEYMELDEVYAIADILSLHVPLLPSTQGMINVDSISKMKKGVILINVSRGALVKTDDLITGLENSQVGAAGLDVYENENELFFKDFSAMDDLDRLKHLDPTFNLLRSMPQVIVTPHSAFLTKEALANICDTTIENAVEFHEGKALKNEVKAQK